MRIAFIGNQDNVGYCLCSWARELGQEADLYLIQHDRGPRSQLELIEPELARAGRRPDWLKQYDNGGPFWFLTSRSKARQIEQNYDVVVTLGATGLIVARQFKKSPLVHIAIGSEVSDFPLRLFKFRTTFSWRIVSFLCRRGLKKAKLVISAGYKPELETLNLFGMSDKTRLWAMPANVVDNHEKVDQALLRRLEEKYRQYDKVFVWLSRLNFVEKSANTYKGPENFLDALERVVRDGNSKVKAIVGRHGLDVTTFERLIDQKQLGDHVDFVSHLSFVELLTYVSLSNAVVFDYITDTAGGIYGLDREALSVGAVLVKGIDLPLISAIFGDNCPIINARNADECYGAMTKLLKLNKNGFDELHRSFFAWAMENLHYPRLIQKLIGLLQEANT